MRLLIHFVRNATCVGLLILTSFTTKPDEPDPVITLDGEIYYTMIVADGTCYVPNTGISIPQELSQTGTKVRIQFKMMYPINPSSPCQTTWAIELISITRL